MADSKPPEGNAPQLSLPELARRGADLVASLPDHMFLSYESDDPRQRVMRIVTCLELNNPGAPLR